MAILIEVLLCVIAFPWVVYFSAKLWAYGSLRGRQLFQEKNNVKKR